MQWFWISIRKLIYLEDFIGIKASHLDSGRLKPPCKGQKGKSLSHTHRGKLDNIHIFTLFKSTISYLDCYPRLDTLLKAFDTPGYK